MPGENRLAAILNRKKAKSTQGFEPGLLGQNATALLLTPPPRPKSWSNIPVRQMMAVVVVKWFACLTRDFEVLSLNPAQAREKLFGEPAVVQSCSVLVHLGKVKRLG